MALDRTLARARRLLGRKRERRHGPRGISELGHRNYVGGLWQEMGEWQFKLLVNAGLLPSHRLLDIGCGALRGGVRFVAYLDQGHYLGIDQHQELIDAGVEELGPLAGIKAPRLVVNGDFECERFLPDQPDFVLAQSLFSHMPMEMVLLCMQRLHAYVRPSTQFFATFFESETHRPRRTDQHDQRRYWFTAAEIAGVASSTGWRPERLGEMAHPRRQVVWRFVA